MAGGDWVYLGLFTGIQTSKCRCLVQPFTTPQGQAPRCPVYSALPPMFFVPGKAALARRKHWSPLSAAQLNRGQLSFRCCFHRVWTQRTQYRKAWDVHWAFGFSICFTLSRSYASHWNLPSLSSSSAQIASQTLYQGIAWGSVLRM